MILHFYNTDNSQVTEAYVDQGCVKNLKDISLRFHFINNKEYILNGG